MLRFFTGLPMAEIARVLGLPPKRIEREWRFARAWLQREMSARESGKTTAREPARSFESTGT
jgi:DNA-directed RNA polymerase specialized sigma24 family protein